MLRTSPARFPFVVCLPATVSLGRITPAQDKTDRPPWARKPKSDANSAATATPPTSDPEDAASQHGKIRVSVNLVSILTSVLDDHNRPAPDLPREAFQIFEEGVEQKLEVFESETEQPLDLALKIDASLSAHKEISFEQEAAAHFIRQVLRPGDRLSVFAIGEDVTQIAGFSDNVATLQAAVHRMPAGSGTSLYDAILFAFRTLERRGGGRRGVLVLVSDAGETSSFADFDAARKAAVKSGALLYTIVVRPVKNESGLNTAGEHALETITDTMGGAMVYP